MCANTNRCVYFHQDRVTNNRSPKHTVLWVENILSKIHVNWQGNLIPIISCSDMFYEKNTGNVYVCILFCEGQKTTCRLKNLRNAESKDILSPITYIFCTDQPILETACTSKYWFIILLLVECRKPLCKYVMQRGNK